MAHRFSVPFLIAVVGSLWICAGCDRRPAGGDANSNGEKPIHELPGVRYVSGEDWFDDRHRDQADGLGWVKLPISKSDRPYLSDVDPYVQGFVPPQICAECHESFHKSCQATAHYRTAEEASSKTVLGSFAEGKNELKTRDPNLTFKMIEEGGRLLQYVSVKRDGQLYGHKVRFDISTGSGNHGQTYLYWHGDELYQLPVSYFSEINSWVNSPGVYSDGTADFARGIGDRCLDCHATYFSSAPDSFNRYDRTNYILGVTCVRCHGPGWAHVQYHKHHPEDTDSRYIVNPSSLPRDRANEVCAQCHSGAGDLKQTAFTYRPGEPLSDYVTLDLRGQSVENDDPHAANQLVRLMMSRCFTETDNLTCFTCHNPHEQERGDLAKFAERCAKCHATQACGLFDELGERLKSRCVSCHMPSRRDSTGAMQTAQGDFLPLLRDHYIRATSAGSKPIVEEVRRELSKKNDPPATPGPKSDPPTGGSAK